MSNLNQARDIFAKNQDALLKTFPEHFNKLTADHKHPSDIQRNKKFAAELMEGILNKARAGKRALSDGEQGSFDALNSIIDIDDCQLELMNYSSDRSTSSTEKRIFNKNEPCSLNYRESNLDGIGLGDILKGLAIGSKGNVNLQNALSEGTDSAGGYSVPVTLMREFVDKLRAKSVLLNAGARTILLDTFKSNMATVVTDPTPGWRAENAAVTESDVVLGQIRFVPKSLAVLTKMSVELLQDSLNVEEILLNCLTQAVATQLDYAGLYGTGASNQPLGLGPQLTTATLFNTVATNGAKLSASSYYKNLVLAAGKVAAANDSANAAIMNPRTKFDLGWIMDSTNQPLMAPALWSQLQQLDTTAVPVNQVAGTSGAVCSEVIVGNFENMALGMRQDINVRILNETFMGNMQIGFLVSMRADWQVLRPSSFWAVRGILAE